MAKKKSPSLSRIKFNKKMVIPVLVVAAVLSAAGYYYVKSSFAGNNCLRASTKNEYHSNNLTGVPQTGNAIAETDYVQITYANTCSRSISFSHGVNISIFNSRGSMVARLSYPRELRLASHLNPGWYKILGWDQSTVIADPHVPCVSAGGVMNIVCSVVDQKIQPSRIYVPPGKYTAQILGIGGEPYTDQVSFTIGCQSTGPLAGLPETCL